MDLTIVKKGRRFKVTSKYSPICEKKRKSIITFVNAHFDGRTDKGGKPYTQHLLRVALNSGEPVLGLLHDAIEDLGVDTETLAGLGCTTDEIAALDVLSRRKHEQYESYIGRVIEYAETNKDAAVLKVKKADLKDNMCVYRLPPVLTEQDFHRLQKYRSAYERIVQALKGMEIQNI